MTRLAGELLRDSLVDVPSLAIVSNVCENVFPYRASRDPDAA